MSVEQPYLLAARTVLEGRHGFQYPLPEQQKGYEDLATKVQQGLVGEMILVNGAPGCGVTYCLKNLARNYPRQCLMLQSNLYHRHVTLTDRVCDAISTLRESESYKEPPAWLIEYAQLTGLKFLIFDDLDKYVTSAKEIDLIMYEVEALNGWRRWRAEFTVVISTRNMKLIRRFIKFNSPRQRDIWVGGVVTPNTLDAMGAEFFRWNNQRFAMDIQWGGELDEIEYDFDLQVDSVVKLLELSYVTRMIPGFKFESCSSRKNLISEELQNELLRILYQ